MSDFSGRLLTDAIIAALTAAGLTVGDGEKPSAGGWSGPAGQSTFAPYVVVYPLVGGSTSGTIAAPDADATPLYQLTSVGGTRAQAEWAADKARTVMLSTSWWGDADGRKVIQVRVDMLGGARRDDLDQPPLWYSPDRYGVYTTPA